GISFSKSPGIEKLRAPARAALRFSKSWGVPPGTSTNEPLGASVHAPWTKKLMVPSMTKNTSSSSCACAPGPLVCGSSHHSEIEYLPRVSPPSALKTAEMRPIGQARPSPGRRISGWRFEAARRLLFAMRSVDDEELRADIRVRAMGFGVVGDLVAHARAQDEGAAVAQLRVQLAFDAQQDVALHAPVIREIARRVLHHAHADPAEVPGAPVRRAALAAVLRGLDLRPVRRAEWDGGHVHGEILSER